MEENKSIAEEVKEVEDAQAIEKEDAKIFAIRSVAKKADNLVSSIRNTFHGFFGVMIVIAIIAAIILYKTNNTGIVTIDLPVLKFSYFKIAVIAIIVSLLGIISTSKK